MITPGKRLQAEQLAPVTPPKAASSHYIISTDDETGSRPELEELLPRRLTRIIPGSEELTNVLHPKKGRDEVEKLS
jgi:hypothetical protein